MVKQLPRSRSSGSPADAEDADAEDLDAFRSVQALAYECAEQIASQLEPGVTERETTRAMKRWLDDHGVEGYLHLPFAWFGSRAALRFHTPLEFFPTRRKLADGMPFILDVAPIRDGYLADIGYSGCLGENAIHEQLLQDLKAHRDLVLDEVRARRRFDDIYRAVDRLARDQGYDPRHRKYPGRVIAHQVTRVSSGRSAYVANFGNRALFALGRSVREGIPGGYSALWNGSRFSHHPPVPGLWAVEPHLAFRDVAAKFEEILVITEDDAFWLDDDLPHVRRWAKAAA